AGIDQVVATVEALGIAPGYALNMPSGNTGVFTASVYPDDITQERVIHLDQYTGEVLYDATLADLGALGWAAEWGVSIHMGQAFGLANQLILLLSCVAMVVMCVAGGVMWWKRRPSGALGVPQIPADWRIPRTLLVMAIVAGVFFPLVGLTLIVLAVIEGGVHLLSRARLRAA
ncbi:MAG: PepSY domain-containing protein, partial [Pseudomonadota bacterium]|nr:PepSY domain-containing protein [Pseudomonadota bacterium]